MEVAGFLEQHHEHWTKRIHPADVSRILNEVRREERSDYGLDDTHRCADADVVCVISENVFRVKC